ncbi:MAG: PAS domain S-box protein [Ignavibacteriaceae bacterium]|jgi:PAS domain S-box-containing protein|nr:PAS domain S-box protein [Ignavibacteriaceae bacterium]
MLDSQNEELQNKIRSLEEENNALKRDLEVFSKDLTADINKELKAFIDYARIGIAILNFKGNPLITNTYLQNLLQYNGNELRRLTFREFTHPNDVASDSRLYEELVAGLRQEYKVDKRYIRKDGEVVNAKATVSMIFDKFQNKKYILAFIEDVTEQLKIEKKLHSEQALLSRLMEGIPDSIYFKDLQSRFIKVNNAAAKKLGFSYPEELIGKSDADIFGKEHSSEAFNDEQSIIKTRRPLINKEEKEVFQDGKVTWASTTKLPLFDENGKIIGTFGISRDVTEDKKIYKTQEAVFKVSEAAISIENFDLFYQEIHSIISELMPAENFYIALFDKNKNTIKLAYFVDKYDTLDEIEYNIGKGLTEYVIKTGKAILVDAAKDAELREKGEVELVGEPQAIWMGVPLKIQSETFGVIALQDYENPNAYTYEDMQILIYVSEQIAQVFQRRRANEEINRYTEELKQLNMTKDKFFSIIAHDLRNPFITILGFSELLLSDFQELTEEEKIYYIEEMQNSANLSHNLLQNLLQWSRSQTGRIDFSPRIINIHDLVNQNFELLKQTAAKKEISLVNEVDKIINIEADEDMTDTIFRNLITNAIKFTPEGGSIKIDATQQGSMALINVSDTGVGMDEETKSKLFRLDVNHSSLGTSQEKGTGLGLILCKEFVEKHNGKIWIESSKGEGTTFSFTLPIKCQNF